MESSILKSIKKPLGVELDYPHFDADILIQINAAMFALMQLGVGPDTGFFVTSEDQTWQEFLGDRKDLEMGVTAYVLLRTKLSFDPPSTGYLIDAIKAQISEFEWRLRLQAEPAEPVETVEGGTPSVS